MDNTMMIKNEFTIMTTREVLINKMMIWYPVNKYENKDETMAIKEKNPTLRGSESDY